MDAGSDRCPIGGVKSAVEEAIWQGGGAGLAGTAALFVAGLFLLPRLMPGGGRDD